MKKPLVFVDQSGLPGGAELCLADLARGFRDFSRVVLLTDGPFAGTLRRDGIEVSVLSRPAAGIVKGASIVHALRGAMASLPMLPALRAALGDARVAYLNTAKAIVWSRLAFPIGGPPMICHLHDLVDRSHFSRANRIALVGAANRCKAAIANSHATARAFKEAGGTIPVTVIPNGFDPAPFDAVDPSEVKALRQHFNPTGAPCFAVFGRIARWKGQHLALEALRGIPDAIAWIVGTAFYTDDDRRYEAWLHELAGEKGLAGRVVFAGHVEEIPKWMKAADAVVHTSVAPEPFGRVLVEAMLAGKPVIAADAAGPAEILQGGRLGRLFPPGNSTALREILEGVLAGGSDIEDLTIMAGQAARENYAIATVREQTRMVLAPFLDQ